MPVPTIRFVLSTFLPALAVLVCSSTSGIPTPQDAAANRTPRVTGTGTSQGSSQQTPAIVSQTAGDAKANFPAPAATPATPGGSIGSKGTASTDLTAPPPDVTETFAGTGTLAFVDQTYDVQQRTMIKTTSASLTVQVTQASSSNGDVNDGLQSSVGTTTFNRVDAVTANIPVAQRFLLFTDSCTGSSGKTTFSTPLPVFAYPANTATRYSALDSGAPLSFSASATGPAGQAFTVNVTVAKATATGGAGVGISIKANIPQDTDGTLYQLIGLSAGTVESIDLGSSRVVALSTDQFYHTDKTPGNPFDQLGGFPGGIAPPELQQQAAEMSQRQPMHIDYQLCTYTGADGKTQQLGC